MIRGPGLISSNTENSTIAALRDNFSCTSMVPAFGCTDGFCFGPFHRFYSFHWARIRDNSCARRLRVFCLSGSSQQIF